MVIVLFALALLVIGALLGGIVLALGWIVVGSVIWVPLGMVMGYDASFVLWCLFGLLILWLMTRSDND